MDWMRGRYRTQLVLFGVAALAGCRASSSWQAAPADDQVVLQDRQVADVQVALGRTLEDRGQVSQAYEVYAEAVRRDPTRADAYARLAVLADKQAMFTESTEHHAQAVLLRPVDPDLHCNLGYSLYLQHKWPEAERALRRAIELRPDHARALNNLGLVLARAGQTTEAEEAFRRAGGSEADAHTNVAYALAANGDWEAARQRYTAALAAEPASETAKAGLMRINAVAARAASAVPAGAADETVKPAAMAASATLVAEGMGHSPRLPDKAEK